MKDLKGKTAVVTGGASGIGLGMVTRFAKAGMNVVISDIEEPALDSAIESVNATLAADGDDAVELLPVVTDVSDNEQVEQLAATAFDRFEKVAVLCNNAGVAGNSLTSKPGALDLKDWKWVMDVNLWGVVYGHAAFLPHMIDNDEGHIVNTASMAGHFPGHSAYTASKWAVVGISEGLHGQMATEGHAVGVSCLCPGWVNTKIAESARNKPEWAAGDTLAEPSEEQGARMEFIKDQLRSGMDPTKVGELVHDAIVTDQFWVFTDLTMVAALEGRFKNVLQASNPDIDLGAALSQTN